MGLTNKSLNETIITDDLNVKKEKNEIVIALAGNPNVGKSSIFNELTGMNQHTGNWPGKTVGNMVGSYTYKNKKITIVDTPGTYSLMANSPEEEIARDFICFSNVNLVVVVADSTNLERNLNLVLQIKEAKKNVILCLNLIDEAKKQNININTKKLSELLNIDVVETSTKKKIGINNLKETIFNYKYNYKENSVLSYNNIIEEEINNISNYLNLHYKFNLNTKFIALNLLDNDKSFIHSLNKYYKKDLFNDRNLINLIDKCKKNLLINEIKLYLLRDEIISNIMNKSKEIIELSIITKKTKNKYILDKLITNKYTSLPFMVLLLLIIFWITIVGANYPSELLTVIFNWISNKLIFIFDFVNIPNIISDFLINGIYKTVTWIIAVMLPPMAIFFPLFTYLEDLGFLPRIAFNMDNIFKKCGSHGKQSLTMCMGFGCNACGVVGSRIIEEKKDRELSILTNNFVPCNGRFPTIISIISMFLIPSFDKKYGTLLSALILTSFIFLSIVITLLTTKLLSKTLYKNEKNNFLLELPPYRKPKLVKTIIRSIFDRTIFVLKRAIKVSIPAGAIIWLLSNTTIQNNSISSYIINFLEPIGNIFGMDGTILLSFILGFPANEIVIPLIIMNYLNKGNLIDISNLDTLKNIFVTNGWTITTALCVITFSIFHYPCSTTLLTIKKETNSNKLTLLSFLLPTMIGLILCFLIKLLFS